MLLRKVDTRIKKLYVTIDKKLGHLSRQLEARFDQQVTSGLQDMSEKLEMLFGVVGKGNDTTFDDNQRVDSALEEFKREELAKTIKEIKQQIDCKLGNQDKEPL